MKKQNLKNLRLNKSKIANFKSVVGGRPNKSFYETECDDCSPSEQTNCLNCDKTAPNHACTTFIDCTYDC
ncbi:hypothetical protein IMCC3317_32510 [Kordia antarctica]|uniref:Uncharacterized protein n=1 Tax=Kordia antarctica TaxID=1218801 RepID=A0A7L4ZMC3_9FLAO|nr:hypothetical protein [Kordia antarctica]QHI37868.1 hypothetical protein IMCC3317_32510 [Kordia antarctica]